ncbi:hypothetical protein ACFZCG_38570 [Streptomyces tanashiensis]|uniref:hypothetical protein n=1 Tax=Streptomyces tanashiensis TaxID=67367 RepID=UPI0036E930AA
MPRPTGAQEHTDQEYDTGCRHQQSSGDVGLAVDGDRRCECRRDLGSGGSGERQRGAYELMEPRELFGTYTIIVVDHSIMACNGFEGDLRDATGTSS